MRIPLAAAAVPYLSVSFGFSALACWGWRLTGHPVFAAGCLIAGLLGLSLAWFFRDPERVRAIDPTIVLAPGDGLVRKIHRTASGSVVEIFLAVWNVHVQRAPVSGRVVSRRYRKGTYLVAYDDRSGARNTRCALQIVSARGKVGIVQVAGAIARKVECWVKPGDHVRQGQRIGIIHMGSQVRLELPRRAQVLVKPGMSVCGGLTCVAKWR